MAKFEEWFPRQAANVQRCGELPQAAKERFFVEIDGAAHATRSDAEGHARSYFRSHKFLGGSTPLRGPGERLGRLHEWTAIEELASRFSISIDKLDSYRDSVRVGDMSLVEELLDLLGPEPMAPVVWCFRGSSADTPFRDVDSASLPCRLALPKLESDDYLPLEVLVPSGVVARKSTAFDGAFQEHWCPGGMSCPRVECSGEAGLPELVVPGKTASVPEGLTFQHARPPASW